MCGRYALQSPPTELITRFGLDECAEFGPRYNIPPGTDIPVIRQSPEGNRVLHLLRWGLVPHWSKDPGIGAKLYNARGESVADKPSFRDAFKRRRCLIPANGFFEWAADGKIKKPYYISLKSGEPMAMGGLWESWKAPEGGILRTVCVVTTSPNAVMEPIHDRMPVIVAPEHWQYWLAAPVDDINGLVVPCDPALIVAWPVDRRVSRTTEDDPALLAEVK
jgi:putative SOS response-associated peptidase YedK